MQDHRILLPARELPDKWYNVAADLPKPIPPHRHPATGEPVTPADMLPIFPPGLLEQEVSTQRWIDIPDAVREKLAMWRPTPLISTPKGIKPAEVPLDPALAIANRYGKLAQ